MRRARPSPADGASAKVPLSISASISASAWSDSLYPSGPKSLMPLSSKGLCEAEITTPRSARIERVSMATAGVGIGPTRTTSIPMEMNPAVSAGSSM